MPENQVLKNSSKFKTSAKGKGVEHFLFSWMIKKGLDVYLPIVDDKGIDAIVRLDSGNFAEIQIKSSSREVKEGDRGLFANIHHELSENFWFIFHSEGMERYWLLSSKELIDFTSPQSASDKAKGRRRIKFTKIKKGKEVLKPEFEQFVMNNFNRILNEYSSPK